MSLDTIAGQLDAALPPGAVGRDVPVAELTTYRLGGPVAVAAHVTGDTDLAAVATAVRAADPVPPVLVVGRGSNLLVADRGFAGVAVVLGATPTPRPRPRAAARRCRSWPAAPRRPAAPASSSTSASPARWAARCA